MAVELRGRVVERGTGRGLEGLRVQAWASGPDPAGEAGTDKGGGFLLDGGDTRREHGPRVHLPRAARGGDRRARGRRRVDLGPAQEEVLIEVLAAEELVTDVLGRLTGRNGAALPGLVVELRGTDPSGEVVPLGAFRCDEAGRFAARLGVVNGLSAAVRAEDGTLLDDAKVVRRRADLRVTCSVEPVQRTDPPLVDAAEALGIRLPDQYLARLADAGVTTLGEFGRAADDVVEPKDAPDQVPALRAAAGLRTLTTDLGVIRALVGQGYAGLTAIAEAPAGEFAQRVGPLLEPEPAGALQASARAQQAYLARWSRASDPPARGPRTRRTPSPPRSA